MFSYLMVIGSYHISDDDVFKDVGIIVGAIRGHCGSCMVKAGHTTPKKLNQKSGGGDEGLGYHQHPVLVPEQKSF